MFFHTIPLFRLFGFQVKLDASWLLLAILVTWSLAVGFFPQAYPGLETSTYWWMGVVGLIGLAASIILHEFAHAIVARRFDMPIRGITLFLFGGVAEMEREPPTAKSEFLMAIAGPIMSFVLALIFYLLASALAGEATAPVAAVAVYLAMINMLLAVFNLVPAFPLDGGRMLRAALWGWKGDLVWATRIAATLGSAFGILLIVLGFINVITGNFIAGMWWFLIGLFIRGASNMHYMETRTRSALTGRPVSRFMHARPISVSPDLTIAELVDNYFYRHYHKSFPVTEDGRLIGCISLDDIKQTDRAMWGELRVSAVMKNCGDQNTIAPDADAAEALTRMRQNAGSRLLVSDGGKLVGVITLRDLLDYLALTEELGGDAGQAERRIGRDGDDDRRNLRPHYG